MAKWHLARDGLGGVSDVSKNSGARSLLVLAAGFRKIAGKFNLGHACDDPHLAVSEIACHANSDNCPFCGGIQDSHAISEP